MDIRNIFTGTQYLRAADLQGKQFRLTIMSCDVRNLAPEGQASDEKPVLKFKESDKEFACNRTNSSKIAETLTNETDNWSGNYVTLAPSMTNFRGAEVPCIRDIEATANGKPIQAAALAPAELPQHDPANGEVPEEAIPF